jgi:hypothetical protein
MFGEVIKSVNKGVSQPVVNRTMLTTGTDSVNIRLDPYEIDKYKNSNLTEFSIKGVDNKVTEEQKFLAEQFEQNPLGAIVLKDNSEFIPLSRIYNYTLDSRTQLSQIPELKIGTSFRDIVSIPVLDDYLRDIATDMFNKENPLTKTVDVPYDAFYTPTIPLIVGTNTMVVQEKDGIHYFNPNGVVPIAELLDGFTAIKFGANSNRERKESIDKVSNVNDYFNEGYQECVNGYSSPFYNLYTKEELLQPVTRLELAYITVLCWRRFLEKYDALFGGAFELGINFDWLHPADVASMFKDIESYNIGVLRNETGAVRLNIKDYLVQSSGEKLSMKNYLKLIKNGKAPIPLPMIMSLIELGVLDLFYFEGGYLNPLREVSRGEMSYFLTRLADNFSIKYTRH